MRTVFMGTADFAVPSLKKIVNAGHQVDAVITQPDRPKGRGQKVQPSPVKAAALDLGLVVFQPESIKDPEAQFFLQKLAPELIVVVAYGQILPASILDLPPFGCINLHASLLPAYRGAAPIHWAIINGEEETGVSTMYMARSMDSGDVILQKRVPIEPQDTAGTLHDKLAEKGAELLIQTLELLARGSAPRFAQDESKATYAPQLTREHEEIDWSKSNRELANLIRGMNPWPGAYTTYKGKVLKILEAESLEKPEYARAGAILSLDKNRGFVVQCGRGALLITKVKPQGKQAMEAAAFCRGYNVEPGIVLGSRE
ncbi:methionyl-tRNA formyltransferase [Zhaonella formicivorans]|uniref:methionyl-tRNA formyltransferase n=1 Tax=Zhaonella formicivorans TaxID=2528593 RepID=UPI0010E8302F|nr:methionyl-tRNA formyltransferase [Zhaonella formicivorans]